ncbi:DUF3043 domain-containing protein [Arthrobacter sp. HLT1-21]
MFGRRKEGPEAPVDQLPVERSVGKGVPTPRRSSQVAARKRPLVPDDRKAAKAAGRDAQRAERLKTRQALDTGDERYLPLRDKGPNRRYVREFVDARWNLGEFLMVAALVFVLLSFVPSMQVQAIALNAFWIGIIAVVVDCFLLRRSLKKRLTAKFGEPGRGDLWYGVTRALQLRRLRLPKALVKRGQYPA